MLTSFLFAAAAQSSAIKLEVIFSETANLTYHLDTVAGLLRAGDPRDIQALWKAEILKSDKDQAMIAKWATLRRKYDISAPIPGPEMEFIPSQSSIDLDESVRAAGLEAESIEEYSRALNLVTLPTEAHEFVEIVRYFQPTFHKWWTEHAQVKGQAFADGMQKLLSDPRVSEKVEQFRKFYGSRLPNGYRAPFSLIYRPMKMITATSGQQLGRMAVVEFLPMEKPEQRLDVVLHEFCHFLYGTRSPEDDQALQLRFVGLKDIAARPAYNLINEGMASAMGNGVINRIYKSPDAWTKYLATPESFYNNTYIDRAGKSILMLMDEWLPKGKTMNDADFPSTYVAALKKSFGDEITSPTLFLNESFIYVNNKLGSDFGRSILQTFRVSRSSMSVSNKVERSSTSTFREMPNMTSIFVVGSNQLGELGETEVLAPSDVIAVRQALRTSKSLIYAVPRGSMAHTFVLVADDKSEAEQLTARLAKVKTIFRGVMQ